jgi:heterodisulfide reductase subunit C
MDYSPREIIAMIRAGLKKDVLTTNTFWFCSSCYHCSVKCPRDINITDMMYALKRYSIWKDQWKKDMIGPDFSKRFTKTIINGGKSFEPGLAPAFIFKNGLRGLVDETQTALTLFRKGRLPLTPSKVKRLENFQRMLNRIIPMGGEL